MSCTRDQLFLGELFRELRVAKTVLRIEFRTQVWQFEIRFGTRELVLPSQRPMLSGTRPSPADT